VRRSDIETEAAGWAAQVSATGDAGTASSRLLRHAA
jgi:hypothetical protein